MVALLFLHDYNYPPYVIVPSTCVKGPFSITNFIELFCSNSLLRFRMGLLMAISGYLMANSKPIPYKDMVFKKVKSLLVPYVVISFFGIVVTFLFETAYFGWHKPNCAGMIGKSVWAFTWKDYAIFLFKDPISFQLWYLKTIFMMALLSPAIKFILEKVPMQAFAITFVIWMFTNYLDGVTRDRAFIFYGLGYYLRMYNKDVFKPIPYLRPKYVFIAYILVCLLRASLSFSDVSQTHNLQYLLTILFKVVELLGGYSVWFCFDRYAKVIIHNKWYLKYGACSFFVYAFHAPALNFINKILLWQGYYNLRGSHLFFYLVLPVFIMPIMIIMDRTVKRFFPNSYAIISGGRGKKSNVISDTIKPKDSSMLL
jgi:fucose 4-O-acetylase-like acetyltransferase